jgi:ribosome maturation factor RimP
MGPAEQLREAIEPIVRAAGLSLWDVERSASVVRVLIDRPEGVDLEAISAVTPAVSALLEARDDLVPAAHYALEVSSPGVERSLRRAEQFQRYVGSEVALKTASPVAGARRLQGTLVAAGSGSVTVAVDEADGAAAGGVEPVEIDLSNIQRAHTVFRWGAEAKPSPSKANQGAARHGRSAGAGSGRAVPAAAGAVSHPTTLPTVPAGRRSEVGEDLR